MKLLYQILLLLFIVPLSAQDQLAIGEWRSHLPTKRGIAVSQSQEKVYYASEFGLIVIDKSDFSMSFMDKVNGLSDVGISALQYNQEKETLILAYSNGKLDILSGSEIQYVSDLFTNANITGSREINSLDTQGDFVYLATNFGLVQYNLEEENFGFTCFTSVALTDVKIINSIIFMATEDGLYSFDLNSNLNPADFTVWRYYSEVDGLEALYECRSLAIKDGRLFLGTADKVFSGTEDGFELEYAFELDEEIRFLSIYNEEILVGTYTNDINNIGLHTLQENNLISIEENCTASTNDAIQDQNGVLWIADDYSNIRYLENGSCKTITPPGPFSESISEMKLVGDRLFIVSGGVNDNYVYSFNQDGFYILEPDGTWTNENRRNNSFIDDNLLVNLFTIASHPTEPIVMMGSFYSGLIEYNYEEDSYTLHDKDNSSLQGSVGDGQRTRISGLAYDNNGNLWVSNHLAGEPLSVYTNEGEWISFPIEESTKLAAITIDPSGRKWILVEGLGGGIMVFDEGDSYTSPNDVVLLGRSNSEIEAEKSFSIETDREGTVWLGTRVGPVAFNCGSNVFEFDCLGDRRIVQQDGINAILLATEDIRSMVFDGANRMWVGTKNGVFILSPDTENQIYHYTSENSPLFDDSIIDLVYDGSQGLMYVATDKGLLSIRTEATNGPRTHSSNIYAFPNPVTPDYNGPIAIKGLAEDVNVKITDVNGLLVYETTALGGQAIWNGMDYNGNKAASGVYLVFTSTTDTFSDIDTHVTKVLIVR